MTTFAVPNTTRLAYLSVTELPDLGYAGGLLVVDERGRPLEFHCTTPVVVSRAQELLFGATLKPHVFVDCIGKSLIKKLGQRVDAVMIEDETLHEIDSHVVSPVVMLEPCETTDRSEPLPGYQVRQLGEVGSDDAVLKQLVRLQQTVDPTEPFARISEAIREAHQHPSEAQGQRSTDSVADADMDVSDAA